MFRAEAKMKNSKNLRMNWTEIKENLKKKFAKLTDNDLLFEEYQKTEMMNRIQKKLGMSREDIQKIISDL